MRPKPDQVSVLSFDRNSYLDAHIDDTACFGQEIVTVSLVSSALYWLTDGTYAEAHIVEPGDVVVLRGEARYKYKHGVAKPKLNEKLDAGVTRLITDRGAPRLELGVGHRGKMRGVVFRLPSALLFRLALCRALDPEMCMSGSSLA